MPDMLNKKMKTPVGEAPVVPVILMALGGYLTWFGVRYWRSDTAWPSDPLKAVLTGKPIPVPDRSSGEAAIQGIVQSAQSAVTTQSLIAGVVAGGAAGSAAAGDQTLTKDQIAALWKKNGGAASKANLAAAIAFGESSGRTGVTSPNPDGGQNVGLWQLDTKGAGAGHTVAQLQNPDTNAQITVMKSANGTNWHAWEAYTNGAYKKYL